MTDHAHRDGMLARHARALLIVLLAMAGGGRGTWAGESDGPPDGYNPKGRRDPFIALVREGRIVSAGGSGLSAFGSSSSLVLGGILWDPNGKSIAMISDLEVRVGDAIGDYTVSEIRPDAVVLMKDGTPLVLEVVSEETGAGP